MRILLLATDVYGGHGGIAMFNRQLTVAAATYPGCTEVVVVPRLIQGATERIPPGVTFLQKAAAGPAAYLRTLVKLMGRKGGFQLVISGHINLLPIARLFSRHPLLFIHGIDAWKPVPRASPLIRGVGAVVSVSDITLRRFLAWSHYRGKTFLLPNTIDLQRYGILAKNRQLAKRYEVQDKTVLLTLGRITARERYKGFDEVIETLPALLLERDDLVYLIAGGGDDIARLRQKAEALGVGNHVRFNGFVAEEDKPGLYSLADAFVMPSRGEGFGIVLLEAMASGIPVIASKHDGGSEALRKGLLGTLVDPTNPAEIKAAILDALVTTQRRVPDGLDEFSIEKFTAHVHALLDDVRSEGTPDRRALMP